MKPPAAPITAPAVSPIPQPTTAPAFLPVAEPTWLPVLPARAVTPGSLLFSSDISTPCPTSSHESVRRVCQLSSLHRILQRATFDQARSGGGLDDRGRTQMISLGDDLSTGAGRANDRIAGR